MPDYTSLRNGLVGAWCPSLGASGYTLLDRSGYGNHGTLINMDAGTDWVASGSGLALDFDGSDDYATIPIDLTPYNQIAVSLWLIVRTHTNTAKIILELTSNFNGNVGGFLLAADDPDQGGSYSVFTKTSDYLGGWFAKPSVNTWHHWVVNFVRRNNLANNGAEVFIDGLKQSFIATRDVTDTGNFLRSTLYVAARGGSQLFADAILDDIRIYNHALTPSEVQLLYTGGRGVGLQATRKRVYGFVGVTDVSLTPNNIAAGTPVVGSTTLTQNHALTATGITAGTPVVGTTTLSQNHALTGSGIAAGTPVVGTTTLSQNHASTASGITAGTPSVGSTTLSQNNVLIASGITAGTPVVGTTTISQIHALTASGITAGTPVVGNLTLVQAGTLQPNNLAAGTPVLGSPALTQNQVLTAIGITAGSPSVATTALSQTHVTAPIGLLAGLPVFGATTLSQNHAMSLSALAAGSPTLGTPNVFSGTTILYVRVNGAWKAATPYVRVNGVWKAATPYVKVNGVWK